MILKRTETERRQLWQRLLAVTGGFRVKMFSFQVLIPNSWFDLRWKSEKNDILIFDPCHKLLRTISLCMQSFSTAYFFFFLSTLCFWAAAVQLCSNSTSALLLSSRHRLTAPSQSLLRGSHLCPWTELAAYETLGNTSDSKCFLLSRWASMKSIFKREWCRCHDDEEMFPTLKGWGGWVNVWWKK